jgi:hypothetical protein
LTHDPVLQDLHPSELVGSDHVAMRPELQDIQPVSSRSLLPSQSLISYTVKVVHVGTDRRRSLTLIRLVDDKQEA